MSVYIYLIREPRTGYPRYVGQSVNPRKRLHAHRYAGGPVGEWLRSLDVPAELEILEETDDWKVAERRWVAVFFDAGVHLLNRTSGGDYAPMAGREHTAEFKQWQAERLKGNTYGKGNAGKRKTAEHRAKISAGLSGHAVSPATMKQMRGNKLFEGRKHSEETKAKIREALTGRTVSAETRARLSAAQVRVQANTPAEERSERARLRSRAHWDSLTPEQRSEQAMKSARTRWG